MNRLPLAVVDGRTLPEAYLRALRPGESLIDAHGNERVLPRDYMRIESWDQALGMQVTPHFNLWELIGVDVREAAPLRAFPRYVPCALLLLSAALEVFRTEVGTYVHIAANGGYRSPGHALSRMASRHCWGTAANIYRVGDTYLETPSEIEGYADIVRRVLPGVWVRPVGDATGEANDHLHIDLGYTIFEPTQ